ncbi:MAG: hypothetical protein IPJ79_20290 [Bacteroidetes bacterium]|nr:hypothetical protein [Bacteroidota bacterium]
MQLRGRQHIIINDSKSKLGFATTGDSSWEVWDRFITYDGQQLFHIGNVCGTCNFFFTRQENKLDRSIATGELIANLNNGLTDIDIDVAKNYSSLFPNDTYEVLLLEIFPHLTFPNDKDDYFVTDLLQTWEDDNNGKSEANTEYYRGSDRKVKDDEKLLSSLFPFTLHQN